MCQGNNTASIDICPSVHNLPATHKYVSNAIINSGIVNNSHGYRHLYIDNRYAVPQLFVLIESKYNMIAVGTCRANRKVFDS